MNILFYHYDETCPTMGGIQRTTALVADGLKKQFGYTCYNIYNYPTRYPMDIPRYNYEKTFRLPQRFTVKDVVPIIQRYHIDVIVNQGTLANNIFYEAAQLSSHTCKVLYFHHTTPRRLWDLTFSGCIRNFKRVKGLKLKLKGSMKILTFPLYRAWFKWYTLRKNANNYRRIYDESDRFVLLSERFFNEWCALTEYHNPTRLMAIPNASSFTCFADEDVVNNKKKRLLFVGRMSEFPKRVHLAIDIWREICKDSQYDDWSFDIVGSGKDLDEFKHRVIKQKIPRITFYGQQNPENYYRESAIFLMTSWREGWPMTLNEAAQMGCVPIVFDSFASVRDIIEDGKNGYLIPPFDKQRYVNKLKELMSNDVLRKSMAIEAVKMSRRFTPDIILEKWRNLFFDLDKDQDK